MDHGTDLDGLHATHVNMNENDEDDDGEHVVKVDGEANGGRSGHE